MANEFIIKNGAFVSGSLTVSQSLIANTVQADNIVGNLEYVNISASNELRGKRVRIDADNYLYLNGSDTFPYFGYNPSNNRIVLRGANVSGLNFLIALDTNIDGDLSANTLTGSLDYDQLENVPGFVDSTGDITQNNIAVFADSFNGLPTNLPFSLPLYNDGNATIKAYNGLSYDGTTFTINGGTTKAKFNELSTSSIDTSAASSGSAVGEIVKMGNTTTVPGALYFFSSSATWFSASATHESHSTGMLGVAIGTNSSTDGMLLNGFVHPTGSSDMGTTTGSILYLSPTYGEFTGSAPGVSGEVARIVGYRVEPNMIYFNPDSSYIVLA